MAANRNGLPVRIEFEQDPAFAGVTKSAYSKAHDVVYLAAVNREPEDLFDVRVNIWAITIPEEDGSYEVLASRQFWGPASAMFWVEGYEASATVGQVEVIGL